MEFNKLFIRLFLILLLIGESAAILYLSFSFWIVLNFMQLYPK